MRDQQPTILVPVDVSSEEQPATGIIELLQPLRVVLVGWYPVPDQTAPEQMRDEYEAAAIERIEAIASDFPQETTGVETLVVFTRDRAETVDRVAEDYGCDAVLVARDVQSVERVLVPIRGDLNLEAILAFAGSLLDESDASVTLFHASPEGEEDPSAGEMLLSGGEDALLDAGVNPERIETVNTVTDEPVPAIIDAAEDHDLLIIGETEPSLIEKILGDVPSRIIDGTNLPVLVVRRIDGEDDA